MKTVRHPVLVLLTDPAAEESDACIVPVADEQHAHDVQQSSSSLHDGASLAAVSEPNSVASSLDLSSSYRRCRSVSSVGPEGAPAPVIPEYYDENDELSSEGTLLLSSSAVPQNGSSNVKINNAATATAAAVSKHAEDISRQLVVDNGLLSGSQWSSSYAGTATSDSSQDYARAAAPELSENANSMDVAFSGGDGRVAGGLSRDAPSVHLLKDPVTLTVTSNGERDGDVDDDERAVNLEMHAGLFDSGGSSSGYRTAEVTTHKLCAVPEGPALPLLYRCAEESV